MHDFRFSYNIFGIHSRFGDTMSPAEILTSPFLFIGTIEQMAEQVLTNRDRYGFTHYTVHGPFADAFAPVINCVTGLATPAEGA